ncbi:DUF2064 domain-containing protein [Amycolatopsis sp. 195334CR]|uniref:TIGR04282 family arsenosugar biosynthesis glycosyltransferase n=1 Tax=Amycolatopsis sp. 195334CR TaxID=2814588 RepID=UPI001A8EF50B|nr:DUF2064 domain-containing protein [Amycolatopsis sp. 195334CR]MBN6038487.1 DUF2064 domain-containing protein [Amycolatopsis sp. 195334CR]
MTPHILLVLAKAPCAGKVKTRLCPPASPVQAARIAAAALLDTLVAARAVPDARTVVALSGDLAEAEEGVEIASLINDLPVYSQRGDSLGERIAAAHADAASRYPGLPSLQIGMDTPQASPRLLAECARSLNAPGADAVLGPATDGGWWVLGLRDPLIAASIADVPTSRDDTGRRTTTALRAGGLQVREVPTLSDVDTAEDAVRVRDLVPGSRFANAVAGLPCP